MAWDPFQGSANAESGGSDYRVPTLFAAPDTDPAAPAADNGDPDQSARTPRSSVRVMIVGRDEDDRADTAAVVANCEFTVAGDASYGTQSRVVLDECKPDVVLIAVEEPPARARATISSIRERRPDAPVVAFSGVDDPTIMRAAMRAGVYDFVRRPVRREQIVEAVTSALDAAGTEPPTAEPRGAVLVVMGARGGVGTTSVAAYAAHRFYRESDEDVALVECDHALGGAFETLLDVQLPPQSGLAAIAHSGEQVTRENIRRHLTPLRDRLHVLGTGEDARDEDIPDHVVARTLRQLAETHEFVVADLSGAPGPTTRAVMREADVLAIVAGRDVLSLRRSMRLVETATELGVSRYRMRLILNDPTRVDAISPEDYDRLLELSPVANLGYSNELRRSSQRGLILDDRTTFGREMTELTHRLAGLTPGPRGSQLKAIGGSVTSRIARALVTSSKPWGLAS